jgi:hypothetical protein
MFYIIALKKRECYPVGDPVLLLETQQKQIKHKHKGFSIENS